MASGGCDSAQSARLSNRAIRVSVLWKMAYWHTAKAGIDGHQGKDEGMTPEEYQAILLDLIDRKIITLDEAAELLQRFQAGDFDEESLPLPIATATKRNDDEWLLLFLAFLTQRDRRAPLQSRKRKLAEIRQQFEQWTATDTRRLSGGTTTLRQWHSEQSAIVGGAMLAAWMAGNGTNEAQPTIDAQIEEQLSYLYRFAAENHARQAIGRPAGKDGLIHRAMMYAGALRGAFFRGNESIDPGRGWVSRYIPVDDRRTCRPCRRARGYYLLGDGPWPGEVCFGGWACRCDRIVFYSPDIYEQLTGIAIQA